MSKLIFPCDSIDINDNLYHSKEHCRKGRNCPYYTHPEKAIFDFNAYTPTPRNGKMWYLDSKYWGVRKKVKQVIEFQKTYKEK